MLTAILAVVLPILLFAGVCASYLFYLLSGSETGTGYDPPYGDLSATARSDENRGGVNELAE